jgi:hypothetical protein
MSALEELLAQWRNNPDADSTVALCSYLGVSGREDLVREVGASADTWHAEDGAVMLAVGRMYLDATLLAEAQASLVSAGKLSARDSKPFRYLGEVLLRRGDAARAEKVLARAIQLGAVDADRRLCMSVRFSTRRCKSEWARRRSPPKSPARCRSRTRFRRRRWPRRAVAASAMKR